MKKLFFVLAILFIAAASCNTPTTVTPLQPTADMPTLSFDGKNILLSGHVFLLPDSTKQFSVTNPNFSASIKDSATGLVLTYSGAIPVVIK